MTNLGNDIWLIEAIVQNYVIGNIEVHTSLMRPNVVRANRNKKKEKRRERNGPLSALNGFMNEMNFSKGFYAFKLKRIDGAVVCPKQRPPVELSRQYQRH